MIEYVDAQKCYMTFRLNAAPISSRVIFFKLQPYFFVNIFDFFNAKNAKKAEKLTTTITYNKLQP